ncbi:FUSC family protein [Mycobacterium sp. ACS4331]|uniref:FUSC family protein n=1 Tax=Mycobacterium sp. ACS4331 TaxID=1834121 RepID=UPI0007FCA7EF|nr:FUSC family protein [Mycobacterium sp. ACS4331]OBF11376.1 hypothetical protein A5727_20895 [Mycobacterium sp. ACS4331]
MLRALALRPPWPYVGEVTRSLLGILLSVLVALEIGSAAGAIAAGLSGAIAGAIALQDSPRGRLPLVVSASAAMALAAFVGELAAPHPALYVPTAVLWCLAAGMAWAVSANVGLVAASSSILLVTEPAAGAGPPEALTAALLALLGGLSQAVLVAAWPRQRWRGQRRILTDAYGWLATGARHIAVDPDTILDPTPLIELRETATLTEHQARRRPPAHRGLYGLPERIAMTLNALRPYSGTPHLRAVLLATADALQAISGSDGDAPTARTDADLALRRLTDAAAALHGNVAVVVARLREQVTEAVTEHFGGADLLSAARAARTTVAAQWYGNSPILRHAVRLAAAVGVGMLIMAVTGVHNAYWIAVTVLLVLRPETAHTYTRCVARVAGTATGVLVATTVTAVLQPGPAVAATLAVVFVGAAYAVVGLSYVPLAIALAAALSFLIDVSGPVDATTVSQRLLATIIGGGLAVASHVILPDRSLVRLRQRAGELLKAEIDYAATVIRAFVHPLGHADETLAAVWERATRARSAFEATSGSARADAPEVRRWLMAYRAALNAVTGACATLEEHAPTAQPHTLDPRFVVAVDDYVDALRGEAPRAGRPWSLDARHLGEADQQLRDAASLLGKQDTAQRVLLAETETITRHLLKVADLARR